MQAGVLLGELDRETQAFGPPCRRASSRTPASQGLALGGGIGWIMRKHGLSVDQLVSMDLVTAEESSSRRAPTRHRSLLGLEGGGGNFGIVTEFEFRCVPLGTQVLAGRSSGRWSSPARSLRFYRDWVADAPDELMTIVLHRKAPPLPSCPRSCTASRS